MENDVITQVAFKKLVPSILNPRKDPGDVTGLKTSIIAKGIIIPLVGRSYQGNGKVEIVAGSRRYAAVAEAISEGLLAKDFEVPVIVREMTDKEVVEAMFIENLQREGLSEYDQAESFQQYLYKEDDPSAIKQLAEKVGVTVQYVRRRAKVMELDPKVLAFWKEGKLDYGHMEQMLRLSTEDALEMAKKAVSERWNVSYLRQQIERNNAELCNAMFDKKALGCTKCPHSTQVQSSFFGTEGMKADKVRCTKPSCFITNQKKWIVEHWKETETFKKHGTFKPIFSREGVEFLYGVKKQECKSCEGFVSVLWEDGRPYADTACAGKTECYRNFYGSHSGRTEAPEARKERLSFDLGKKHAEIFYKENMVKKLVATDANDVRRLRVLLLALTKNSEYEIVQAYKANDESAKDKDPYTFRTESLQDFYRLIPSMEKTMLTHWICTLSMAVVLNERKVSFTERRELADQFDLKLERDYVMTEAFLKRMNRDRLLAMNAEHKIVDISPDALKQYKKKAIIEQFLKKDLSGIVPPEIVEVSKYEFAPAVPNVDGSDDGDDGDDGDGGDAGEKEN